MKKLNFKKQKGFTLIETLVSIFILTVALSAFMAIVANSLFGARYAKNEITANYLLQEAVDGIKNDRDTFFQKQRIQSGGGGWNNFTKKYGSDINLGTNTVCFDQTNGCNFDVKNLDTTSTIASICSGGACPSMFYDINATNGSFYTTTNTASYPTSIFKRKVVMKRNTTNPDQVDVTVTVDWTNGRSNRNRTLQISLLNWQQ